MKGLRPIRTVRDLLQYLNACPLDAEVTLVPEDGEGFNIGGVLEFDRTDSNPPQVWILIDEFSEAGSWDDDEEGMVWSGGVCGLERPGDPHCVTGEESKSKALVAVETKEPVDVVKVRGRLRSA